MPKVTKKKKDKQADFQKAKLKLGKGKKQASNATDTSFKARSIALPGQQAIDRALNAHVNEPVTSSGLVLDEVLVRLRHPNGGVRKEALSGVREVLMTRPSREVGKVLRALGGVLSDEDVPVRKALLNFLEWYLSVLPDSILAPHLPLLILQTSSALSHIFPEIRLDACKAVHLLLQHVPHHIVAMWPQGGTNNVLEGLRLAVGLGGDKVQSGKLGASGRLVVLKTLLAFLEAALGTGTTSTFDGWTQSSNQTHKGKERMIGPDMIHLDDGWVIGVKGTPDVGQSASWELGRITADELNYEKRDIEVLIQLYLQLHPLLLNTFLESAPQAFGPSTSSVSEDLPLALCSTVSAITYTLASHILDTTDPSGTSEVRASVADLLRRMAGWFPYQTPHTRTSSTGLAPAFDISLSYARLVVLVAPRPQKLVFPKSPRREGGWRLRVRAVEDAWKAMRASVKREKGVGKGSDPGWALADVAAWVEELLTPSRDVLAPALTPAAYSALLPIIFSLLAQPPAPANPPPTSGIAQDVPSYVGVAFLQHVLHLSSTSATRAAADAFLISLHEIHEQPYPVLPFYMSPSSPVRPLLAEWFASLPRVLWELGTKHVSATDRILRFLLVIGQRGTAGFERPHSLVDPAVFPQISAKLAPFFHLERPTKGSVPGPWTKLPPELRKLGMAVGTVWREWDESRALGRAIESVVL